MAIGIIALVLSVGNAIFAFHQWRRTTQTRIKVKLAPMELWGDDQEPESVVTIKMVNESHHEVAVSHLSFKVDGSPTSLLVPRPLPVHEPLPIIIAPHRNKVMWVPEQTLAAHQAERLRASISTEDDKDFHSRWIVLRDARRATRSNV